jgi:hypothetical protein
MAHDPLTSAQVQLLDEVQQVPIEMTNREMTTSPLRNDIHFLSRAGYLATEVVHVAQDEMNTRYRYSRTAKAVE